MARKSPHIIRVYRSAEDAAVAGLQRLIDAADLILVLNGTHFGISVVDATVMPEAGSIRPIDRLYNRHSPSEFTPARPCFSTRSTPRRRGGCGCRDRPPRPACRRRS